MKTCNVTQYSTAYFVSVTMVTDWHNIIINYPNIEIKTDTCGDDGYM